MRRTRRDRIEGYLARLYGFAMSLTQDRERARDLVQESAVKALAASRQPDDEAAYRAWLFRILRNSFLDGERRLGEVLIDNEQATERTDTPPWRGDERIVDVLTVRIGMSKLSPAHREILGLVDLAGLTYAEAAEVLQVAPGTVISRVSRARYALLRIIEDGTVRPLPLEGRRRAP